MEFRILGPLEVLDEGRVVALGGSRRRALLALLLLHAGEVLPAERIADALWGEAAPPTASRMLHVQVSRLRKALGDGGAALATREHGYVLLVTPEQLDFRRFEALLGQGGAELAAGRPAPAAAALERGLALWRGAPLADLAYEPFAQAEIARLEELRIAAREQHVEAQLALGRHAEVVGPLQALIGEHPYRERLRGQLMVALYRSDRQADALQAYQEARRALVDELGIEPGEHLRRLEQAVLAHDPALDAPGGGAAPTPARAPAPPAPVPAAAADTRRVVTVAVADLTGEGALAERLDPELLHAVMERFTAACTDVLTRRGAALVEGDAVVGVFGLRARREDDPLRAARAALELRDACAALGDEVERAHGLRPAAGIGLATGEVFAGGGARPRGEAMHVAAALAAAAPAGVILLAGETRALAGGALETTAAEPVELRGRRSQVEAWRLDALAPEAPAPPAGPFVAREAELRALRDAVAAARADGGCRRVTVAGPPGIGKSRLARELLAGLGGEVAVTVARCQADEGATSSRPLSELIRGVTGDDPAAWVRERLAGDERGATIAERVLAALGRSEEPAQPGEIAWAVRRVLEAAAAERPLVVVIEDAHWADPALLDLVEYTLAFSGGGPIVLLCLARPELLELRPGWAAPQPDSTLLALAPLDGRAARALLAARDAALAPAEAERIVATAEGNPLFLEQLLAVRAEGERTTLPPSIEAVLAARIDRLDPHEREVLRHAAIEGRSFHVRAVAGLLPAGERDALDRALVGLVQKQLVRPGRAEFAGEDAFRFSHALIREAAYAGMPKRLRGEHHERLADWLRARPRVRDEAVGFHLEQACRLRSELGPADQHDRALAGEAADRLAAAGRAALHRGDAAAAGRLLERAVALVPAEDPARPELLVTLGATLVDAGRLGEADGRLEEAIARARAEGDARVATRARVELELGRQHAGRSQGGAPALAIADSAVAELERHGDEVGGCRAWRLRAWTEWSASRAAAADDAWRRAAELARRAGDERELYEVLGWRASAAAFGPAPVPEAIERCEGFRAQAAGSPFAVALLLHPLAVLHAMTGDFEQARALVAEADAILAELGRMAQAVSHHAALVELLAGRPGAAEAALRPGYDALERMGERSVLATTAVDLARCVLAQGRDAEAAELCAAAERGAAAGDLATHAMWRGVRARLLAAGGDHAAAEALAREAVALIEPTDLPGDRAEVLLDLAEVLHAGGRAADAGRIRERAIALYEEKGNRVAVARVRSWPAQPAPV